MELIIRPCYGVGPVDFGMTMNDVRTAIGGSYQQFKRGMAKTFTDSFGNGLFVLYSPDNRCVAIEMGNPSRPILFGNEIIDRPYCEVESMLRDRDPELVSSSSGCKAFKLGISIYAPGMKRDLNAKVEAVLIFQNGYFDKK